MTLVILYNGKQFEKRNVPELNHNAVKMELRLTEDGSKL